MRSADSDSRLAHDLSVALIRREAAREAVSDCRGVRRHEERGPSEGALAAWANRLEQLRDMPHDGQFVCDAMRVMLHVGPIMDPIVSMGALALVHLVVEYGPPERWGHGHGPTPERMRWLSRDTANWHPGALTFNALYPLSSKSRKALAKVQILDLVVSLVMQHKLVENDRSFLRWAEKIRSTDDEEKAK
jgi:hypothetical protein